ncbi:MAG: ATPase central domain protein [Ignavibacteria bacterium]|nr:ATPase central domain protein [Ignavibacteria bacterium]
MSELFPDEESLETGKETAPLADRMRPRKIDEIVGQQHLLGSDSPLRKFFESGKFPSMIFWGPPGSGKTTIAQLMASFGDYQFTKISAIDTGVKDIRQVIEVAVRLKARNKHCLLFIDEIHRFNKSQQDALLHAVEKGIIILIGATTENPSFEVNSALLSRMQVYRLFPLSEEDITLLIDRALATDEILKNHVIKLEDREFLYAISGGDARAALNALELAFMLASNEDSEEMIINRSVLEKALQQKTAYYDKSGDAHYDTISAFIKSLRGSDPDAALLWLARMLDAGEEPRFIARRMVVFASEDIGNADPFALALAISVFQAVEMIGLPECAINLAQGVTYLASCPKSNASYMGLRSAQAAVSKGASSNVPLHLRNAPTKLMKNEGFGEDYKYPHEYDYHFIKENYFPVGFEPRAFYFPGNFGREDTFKKRLESFWQERYKKK